MNPRYTNPMHVSPTSIAAICSFAENKCAKESGLSVADLRTLARFDTMEKARATTLNSALADVMGEAKTGIAVHAAALKRSGLITRTTSKEVRLTSAGRKVIAAYERELLRTVNRLTSAGNQ